MDKGLRKGNRGMTASMIFDTLLDGLNDLWPLEQSAFDMVKYMDIMSMTDHLLSQIMNIDGDPIDVLGISSICHQ